MQEFFLSKKITYLKINLLSTGEFQTAFYDPKMRYTHFAFKKQFLSFFTQFMLCETLFTNDVILNQFCSDKFLVSIIW